MIKKIMEKEIIDVNFRCPLYRATYMLPICDKIFDKFSYGALKWHI